MPERIPGIEGVARLYPRPWHYNYRVMVELRRAIERGVARELPVGGRGRLVDLGCGTRPYEPLFTGRIGEYVGVDLGDNPRADLRIAPGEPVPLADGAAEVVTSFQVLEHVVDLDAYLSECHRLLAPGGLLLLSTHGTWTYHPYPTDVRRWTCWGLRHEIEQAGFEVIGQDGCVGPLAYTSLVRLQLARGLLYRFGQPARPVLGALSAWTQLLMWAGDRITPAWVRSENAVVYLVIARRR